MYLFHFFFIFLHSYWKTSNIFKFKLFFKCQIKEIKEIHLTNNLSIEPIQINKKINSCNHSKMRNVFKHANKGWFIIKNKMYKPYIFILLVLLSVAFASDKGQTRLNKLR